MKLEERVKEVEDDQKDLLQMYNQLDKKFALLDQLMTIVGNKSQVSKSSIAVWGGGSGTVIYLLGKIADALPF